jgi:toxin ParE1/3/4
MKSKLVEYLPGARFDLTDSAAWYEEQEPGLGMRFHAAVQATEKKLQRNPSLGTPHRRKTRKWRVLRFPYNVVYREEFDRIIIVAIAHGSRQENYWDYRTG